MLAAILILSFAAIAPLGLYALGKSEESRELRMKDIAGAPTPLLPMEFEWRGWVIAAMAFMSLVLLLPCAAMLYAGQDHKVWPIFWLFGGFSALAGFSALHFIRWYFRGPAFVLSMDGVFHAGKKIPWSEISSVRYVSVAIVFELGERKVRRREFLQRSSISVTARVIKDPDGLVGYARRLLTDSKRRGDTSSHLGTGGPGAI